MFLLFVVVVLCVVVVLALLSALSVLSVVHLMLGGVTLDYLPLASSSANEIAAFR